MSDEKPRLAVRAILLRQDELLLVNAYPGNETDLWCAPGGGVQPHQSLPDNLVREVYEETGLTISVGQVAMVNEFHAPDRKFHQVDIYFRCTLLSGSLNDDWIDPEGVVTERRFVSRRDIGEYRLKPDSLADAAWGTGITYDPLELLVR